MAISRLPGKLVRNWAAGIPEELSWSSAFGGLGAVRMVGSGSAQKAVGLVSILGGLVIVELVDATGLKVIAKLPSFMGSSSLEPAGVLRYAVTDIQLHDGSPGVQSIYEVPYDAALGNWTLPDKADGGRLLTSYATASNKLHSSFSGTKATFPSTAAGDVVIFDAGTAKVESYNPHPNQGFHLGVVGRGNGSRFGWQASPWGFWAVDDVPSQLDGVNVTLHYITNETKDGRFGANDSAINYAGSYAMVSGHSIVYGFFGEFWKDAEANQFLHFHDSGLFVGQFGTVNMCGWGL